MVLIFHANYLETISMKCQRGLFLKERICSPFSREANNFWSSVIFLEVNIAIDSKKT